MSADWRSAAYALLLLQALPTLAQDAADEAPSDELLEFLGSFESGDGEWLDPLALAPAETDDEERVADDPLPDEA